MSGKRLLLRRFFKTIEHRSGRFAFSMWSPIVLLEGRRHRVFQGTKRGCYDAYRKFCSKSKANSSAIVKTPRVFHLYRREDNIGVQKAYALIWL
jgi:hypothetical protein